MNEEKESVLPDIKNIKAQENYTLPSKGLVYSPMDGIPASITLRRMTTKEDKIRLRNESEEQIRCELLQACIVEDVDASKLKLMDANYLLFKLRSLSLLDDTYKIPCRCSNCGAEFIHQINLLDVPVKYLNDETLGKLDITLPISQVQIKLKYPSLKDIMTMSTKIREYTNNFPNANVSDYIYSLSFAIYIESVNGHNLLTEELEEYIDNMDIIDSRLLKDTINEIDSTFGFETQLLTKCPQCDSEVKHGLPITSELFTPSK